MSHSRKMTSSFPPREQTLERSQVEAVQLRVMVTDGQEDWGVPALPQFALELLHQQPRALAQAVIAQVHGAAGTLRVAAEHGGQSVTLVKIDLDAGCGVLRQRPAARDAGAVVERIANALARCALAGKTEDMDFRAGHLKQSDLVVVTDLHETTVQRRGAGGAVVARILVEQALDDGDDAPAARIGSHWMQPALDRNQDRRWHGLYSMVRIGLPYEIVLAMDELEAMQLSDLEGLYRSEAAERMGVSRQTIGKRVNSVYCKVADALLNGKALRIGRSAHPGVG